MAGLVDMEELIGGVGNVDAANYLREAFVCYGAGAYRACIVLTFTALFEDIRIKTFNVAKVNAAAKTVSTQIEALAAGQKPFENQLVEQLKAQDLITELQSQSLKQIINHRNKAAHPSGHIASAEEARYVFREAIDKFLSQPVLSTTHAVDEIIGELAATNYFPSRQLSEVAKIVASAIEPVHPSAYRQLVEKVVAALKTPATEVNARFFLQGLVRANATRWRSLIKNSLIEKRSSDAAFGPFIFMLVAIDAQLFSESNAAAKTRSAKLLADLVDVTETSVTLNQTRHPIQLLARVASDLPPADFALFNDFLYKTIGKYWTNVALLKAAAQSPIVLNALVDLFIQKAGSNNFDTANAFAKLLPDLDSELSKMITDRQAFQIATGVIRASDTGAWSAQDVASAKFAAAPEIKGKARFFALDAANVAVNFDGLADATDVADYLVSYLAED